VLDGVATSYLRILVVTAGFNETTSNFFLQLSHILAVAIPRLPALLQSFDHNLLSYHCHRFFRA
jgi:hypothetical protein